jgi:hypothetical protein
MAILRRVRFSSLAAREFAEARDYYTSISPSLGTKLTFEVDDLLDLIRTWPELGQKKGKVRSLPLKRFPYTLRYEVKTKEIVVARFKHDRTVEANA